MSERDPMLEEWTEEGMDNAPAPDLDAMFTELSARIDARPTTARLQDLRSRTRLALGIGIPGAAALAIGLLRPRPDMASYPDTTMLVACVLYAAIMAVTCVAALRPSHVPAPSSSSLATRFALAVGGVFGLASYAAVGAGNPPAGTPLWQHAGACLGIGVAYGAPIYLLLRALDRDQRMSGPLAALSAGAFGTLALQLHCPMGHLGHQLAGHAPVGLALIGLGALFGLARRPGVRRPATR